MADVDIKVHCQSAKLIYCIMKRGHAESVVQAVYQQKHILGIDYTTGRNQNFMMSSSDWQEVDVLTVIVKPERADEIFHEMYYLAKVGQTDGGIVYQEDLPMSTCYPLPELTELVPEFASIEKDVPVQK